MTIAYTDINLLFQYWAYEYMHICVPLASLTDTQDNMVSSDVWPRISRWNRDRLDGRRLGAIRFNTISARGQLEMRTSDSIIWQPYIGSRHLQEQLVEIAFIAS